MIQKLNEVEKKYEALSEELMKPEITGDQEQYKKLMREYKVLTPIIEKFREYKTAVANVEQARELLESKPDDDMKELCEAEIEENLPLIDSTLEELKILLLPRDPNDDNNVIIEIRGGAGGEEAALFSYVLYRMYNMYADSVGWKTEIINENPTELGGFKDLFQ